MRAAPEFFIEPQRPATHANARWTARGRLGEFADLRTEFPTHVDRDALARGWLLCLVVMLAFAGLIFFLRDEPPPFSAHSNSAVTAAPKVPGKFGH